MHHLQCVSRVCRALMASSVFWMTFATAEAPVQPTQGGTGQAANPAAPGSPLPPAGGNSIKIWDDRVFNVGGGIQEEDTRTSAGGNKRYLDKGRELDYNTEQRDRWIKNCASLRETDSKAFAQCYDAQKKKELGSRTNFGVREPRSGSDGLNLSVPGPAGLNGVRPSPVDAKPKGPEAEESGEADTESGSAE